jgi:hypothetical protein
LATVNKETLSKELPADKFLKHTNKGQNEIYVFDYHEAPNLMLEVARLREIAFRQAGGGTGNFLDIDKYDFQTRPYKQLIVWDPMEKEILGGCRFACVPDITENCKYLSQITFSDYFKFSAAFINEYLSWSIELGRAFVQPRYQSTIRYNKSLFALDNLWDGLGALTLKYPKVKYFYGRITLYKNLPGAAKYLLFEYLYNHFGQTGLLSPIQPMHFDFPLNRIHSSGNVAQIELGYTQLSKKLRSMGIFVPPMVNAYIRLSPSMKVLGTFHNKEFGEVDEIAILITIADIYPHKIERHIADRSGKIIRAAC